MRKVLLVFMFFTLFPFTHVLAEEQVYRIGTEKAFPPFSYLNQNGELQGLSIAILERIADKNDVKFEFIPMDGKQAEEALRRGEIDGVAGVTYSIDKEKYMDFSTPYFTMSDSLVIPRRLKDEVENIEDLRDTHIVLKEDTAGLNTLINLRNNNFTVTTNQYNGLFMLWNGRADVFIGNKWTSYFFLDRYELEKQYVVLDIILDPADYAVAVQEGDEEFRQFLDKAIIDLKATGEMNQLVDFWTKGENEEEITRLKDFITILSIFMAIGGFILILIYIWNYRLKLAVNEHTKELTLLNEDLHDQRQRTADSNAFKDQIINNIDAGIITFDLNFMMTSCNSRALDILEWPQQEGIEHSPIFKEVRTQFYHDSANQFVLHRNGQRKIIYYSLNEMYNSLENQAGYLLTIRDETEKVQLEQKLLTQEKLHALGQLVAGVAHEIRNPLTSIKTFINLIPRKIAQKDFQEMLVKHLPKEVDRLNQIVTDLIDYARPSTPRIQPCSASELTTMLTFLHVTMKDEHIDFQLKVPDGLVFYIDPQQIRQVLLNILLNGVDAVKNVTGKRIELEMYHLDGECGEISIKDNGEGMSVEQQHHIFDPFYTTKAKGVGLGLTLSYHLVQENNGDISVTSTKEEGTRFVITLPIYREEDSLNEARSTRH
ncbi:transporter substrate-binding domain-containing protein [Cytobacillus sp. FSL W7-1323]|uniref:transporter substrate-binding domain-containing protein n=1 Tax=unclassified Cytobacillus TaxID=2675268 RepID=UPI002AFE611D|nr:transporter substrate-binding domain-containing protein [Cytobacillus sp. OWB-43]MEA1853812.1 transporter substrate-binding domain-containing protein [Cytobacillus sp. OWB-43]